MLIDQITKKEEETEIILDIKLEIFILDKKFEAEIYLLYNMPQGTKDFFNPELLTLEK